MQSAERITRRIRELGYGSVSEFHWLHGITNGNLFVPGTEGLLDHKMRICNRHIKDLPGSKWSKSELTYRVVTNVPTIANKDVEACFRRAFDLWSAVCGIAVQAAKPKTDADVVVTSEDRDGVWCQLPGQSTSVAMVLDSKLLYSLDDSPPISQLNLVSVFAHQIGHALGLGHLPPPNLMSPLYDPRITRPASQDIQEAVSRYGRPAFEPLPEAPPELLFETSPPMIGDVVPVDDKGYVLVAIPKKWVKG